jgi:SET domain-containing protein
MHLKIKVSTSDKLQNIRCIRAEEFIKQGEIIEECPVVLVPHSQLDPLSNTVLNYYEFVWDETNEAIAFGYGSLYNHSANPNVEFSFDYDRRVIIFSAKHDIQVDEEMFIDYLQGDSSEPLDPGYVDFK